MKKILVLVHCQEAYRHQVKPEFIDELAELVQVETYDKVIHLSASMIWGAKDSPIFGEIGHLIDQTIVWDFTEFEPNQVHGEISDEEIDAIFDGLFSYQDAGLNRMEQARWNIPLEDRRQVLLEYKDYPFMWKDENYSRQFAWIPEIFRNPKDWQGTHVTLGGLYQYQCVNDIHQALQWMGIEHHIDYRLTTSGID